MKAPHTPSPDYARAAFNACQQGRADENQQRSVAAAVILLHGIKGELVKALGAAQSALVSFQYGNASTEFAGDMAANCAAVIAKATAGKAPEGLAPLPTAALAAARAFGAGLDCDSLEQGEVL